MQKLVADNFKSADALILMPHVAYINDLSDPVTDRANAGEHQRLVGKLGPAGPTEGSDEGCTPPPPLASHLHHPPSHPLAPPTKCPPPICRFPPMPPCPPPHNCTVGP